MKKQILGAITALSVLLTLTPACSHLGIGAAKNPVDELIGFCKSDNYKEAAKHMLYDGADASKKNKAGNYEQDDARAKERVERSCKQFKAISELGYKVTNEEVKTQGDKTGYLYDVEIKDGAKTEKQKWIFMKMDGTNVLVDID